MATRCLFLSLLFYFVAFVIQEGHAISMADWHCGSDSYPFSRLFAKKLTKHMCFRQEEVILQINDCCEVHDQCYCEPGETQESCDQVFCECLERVTVDSGRICSRGVAKSGCRLAKRFGGRAFGSCDVPL
ncbi:hypothetical protein QR680_005792 [Steinernema hermaphroditum]|uniref:Phospholipase A2 domain-containing protein n=1 Tax=Steinernema hermaphroditum TaxID=289476 RepID=A0AA39HVJ3_9BILA|nr:hypothetical protein QR680_005792 [Steinernema hermaphroditum]